VRAPGGARPPPAPRHWRRNAGRLVQVEHAGRPLTARIVSADDSGVVLAASPAEGRSGSGERPAGSGHLSVGYDQLGPGRVQIEFNRPRPDRPAVADDASQGS
jgi:ribosome maturation factor RimP